MNMSSLNSFLSKEYKHYNDYYFKSVLKKRANSLLKFLKIPYEFKKELISEYTNLGPNISRMDFVGEVEKDGKTITLILECQTNLPTDEDIKRFFQYVSSIRILKNNNVELFILCTEDAPYAEKEYVIKEDCVYTMRLISLKDFKAKDIFKNIEDKLKNNDEITDEDIASLQLIVYTDFDESMLNILNKARRLFEKISEKLIFDINEKLATIYLFDMLSINMLSESEHKKYREVNEMIANPTERYFMDKGIKEGMGKGKLEVARTMLAEGMDIADVVRFTGLSEEDILNAK